MSEQAARVALALQTLRGLLPVNAFEVALRQQFKADLSRFVDNAIGLRLAMDGFNGRPEGLNAIAVAGRDYCDALVALSREIDPVLSKGKTRPRRDQALATSQ